MLYSVHNHAAEKDIQETMAIMHEAPPRAISPVHDELINDARLPEYQELSAINVLGEIDPNEPPGEQSPQNILEEPAVDELPEKVAVEAVNMHMEAIADDRAEPPREQEELEGVANEADEAVEYKVDRSGMFHPVASWCANRFV